MGAKDYVHLTRKGYERMGELFWDALMAGAILKTPEGDRAGE